jgi:molybdate transport system ATP-binding protein
VGYLFQNYALFPRMTVLDNIRAGLSGPAAEIRRKTRDYIERFELSGLERRFPRQLSGGEQQRTALARMLIREPCLVLLDEPFSALDTNLREQIRLRFLEIVASRRNAILVSHSRDDVYTLCGETLVIDAGASIAMDNTAALFQNPQSVRVARLTGCKNITPVTRKSEREMYARDWGLTLRTALPVTEDISHAGIRAHDFRPASGEGYNEIRPAVRLCAEEPFERTVVFTNAETDDPGGHGALWWKYSAYQRYAEIPRRLFIPPEAVLLLRS